MINEEDHLRLQCIRSGLTPVDAWRLVERIDSELERNLHYAFCSDWGYLTACPTNVGTGMRVSVLANPTQGRVGVTFSRAGPCSPKKPRSNARGFCFPPAGRLAVPFLLYFHCAEFLSPHQGRSSSGGLHLDPGPKIRLCFQ